MAAPLRNPTPRSRLCDGAGRPYFLWDADLTLQQFEELLRTGDRPTRAYLVAKVMRQAKPDDALEFVSVEQIRDLWPELQGGLGRSAPFWNWLLRQWGVIE